MKKITENIKHILSYPYYWLKICRYIFKTAPEKIKYKDKFVFLLITPEHTNLGDHAIAQAELSLLEKGHFVYELSDQELFRILKYGRYKHTLHLLFGKYTLAICGGGFVGTLWDYEDNMVMDIIENQRKNKVVIFPQTVYYDDSEQGKRWLERAKASYNAHPNLTVCTREKVSYDLTKAFYDNVQLIPDMVLSLNECKSGAVRSGALVCLRNDSEKTMSDEQQRLITNFANRRFSAVTIVDMVVDKNISRYQRADKLNEQLDKFRGAELVITDRLHGMIFAAITGTPCAVFESKSHKIEGIYNWCLAELGYIRPVKSTDDIDKLYEEVCGREYQYNSENINRCYDKLLEIID